MAKFIDMTFLYTNIEFYILSKLNIIDNLNFLILSLLM